MKLLGHFHVLETHTQIAAKPLPLGWEHDARDGPIWELYDDAIYYPFRWTVKETIGVCIINDAAIQRIDFGF